MPWGGLNPALTAWRNGINQRFPKRGTGSDGGYADKVHGSNSEHQPDTDGSVDAFDMDVNLFGSPNETGTATERRLLEALKLDFEADRRSHLWIHQREISNEDVRAWAERKYGGASAHDKHVHWESDPAYERDGSPWKFTHTDALLREMEDTVSAQDVITALTSPAGQAAIAKAAGVGVHNQALGRSDVTIAQVLQGLGADAGDRLRSLAGQDVDEAAIVQGVLAGLPAEQIAAAIPEELAEQVAQKLADRLAA